MASKKKSTYTPAPEPTGELLMRVQIILAVQGGILTVSEAARRLGMSRNHFQTLMHRGLHGLVEAVESKPAGRPPKPEQQVKLEEEVRRLRAENSKLRAQLDSSKRFLSVATQFLHGAGRQRGASRKAVTTTTGPTPIRTTESGTAAAAAVAVPDEREEPDGAVRAALSAATELVEQGVAVPIAAATVGCSPATLRRWRRKADRGEPLRRRPGRWRAPEINGEVLARAEVIVRTCRGRIGVEPLRHAVPQLTRSQTELIKRRVCAELEAERKARAAKIIITQPHVMRAMDGVHACIRTGKRILLPIADAAVPYKTSLDVAVRYDGDAVANALRGDFAEHGPPLFLRMDRARQHQVPEIRRLLAEYRVLVLHGPPRYPCFYGQLERQNRDLREWLGDTDELDDFGPDD